MKLSDIIEFNVLTPEELMSAVKQKPKAVLEENLKLVNAVFSHVCEKSLPAAAKQSVASCTFDPQFNVELLHDGQSRARIDACLRWQSRRPYAENAHGIIFAVSLPFKPMSDLGLIDDVLTCELTTKLWLLRRIFGSLNSVKVTAVISLAHDVKKVPADCVSASGSTVCRAKVKFKQYDAFEELIADLNFSGFSYSFD